MRTFPTVGVGVGVGGISGSRMNGGGLVAASYKDPIRTMALLVFLLLPALFDARASTPDSPLSVSLPSDELPPALLGPTRRLLAALRVHEVVSIEERIAFLVALRREALVADLTPVAAAFVARFRHESPTLDAADAIRIAYKAVDLAPDFPPLYFNIAATYRTHDPASVGPMVRAVLDGLRALARYPRGLVTLAGNLAFRASLALSVTLVFLAAMLLVRHVRRLAHDLGDLFPAAPSRTFSASEIARSRRARFITGSGLARALPVGVAGLALFLPIALGVGLVGTGLLWLIVIGPYLRRGGETAVAAFPFAFAVFLWPLAVLAGLPVFLERTEGPLLWRCAHESCGPRDIVTLEAIVDRDGSDPQAAVALALARVHQAPADPAVLTAALRRLDAAAADETVALLRADISLLLALGQCEGSSPDRDRLAEARQGFESVLTSSPMSPEALRGLAMVQGLLGDRPGMEASLARLVQVLPDRELGSVMLIRTTTARETPCAHAATLRAEVRPPPLPDLSLALRGVTPTAVPPILPHEATLLGRVPVGALVWLAPAALVAWILVVRLGRRRDLAYACARCGDITCGACNVRASGFDYCPTCLLEQVRPGFIDPLDLLSLQGRREAKNRLGRLVVPALSLVVPGAGQVLRGRPVRGLFLLGGLAFASSLVWYPLPLHVDVEGFTGPPSGALPALPPFLLAVIYFLSALDVWADRKR